MSTALIVIDFQNAIFAHPGAHEGEAIMGRIAGLIAGARAAGVPVLYVQHDEADSEWALDSEGWAFPAAIAPLEGEHIVRKSICDAFQHSALEARLRSEGLDKLVVCGFATEYCIDTNVRRAASMGLAVVVASDAHTTRDRAHLRAPQIIEHHNAVWRNFGGIELRDSAAIDFAAG